MEDEVVDRGPPRFEGVDDGEFRPVPAPVWAEPGVVALPEGGAGAFVLHVSLLLGEDVIRWTQSGEAGESVPLAPPAEAAKDPRRSRWTSTVWVRFEALPDRERPGVEESPLGRLQGWVVWDGGLEAEIADVLDWVNPENQGCDNDDWDDAMQIVVTAGPGFTQDQVDDWFAELAEHGLDR